MSSLIIPAGVAAKIEMPPVGDLTLEDVKGRMIYVPQPSITPYEVALIMRLFFRMTLGGPNGQTPDWRAFLDYHHLDRHFELVGTIPAA